MRTWRHFLHLSLASPLAAAAADDELAADGVAGGAAAIFTSRYFHFCEHYIRIFKK